MTSTKTGPLPVLVLLLTATPVDAPAQKWIGRAVRSGVLRGWAGARHRLFKRKIRRTKGDLKRVAKHIGLKKKIPVYVTSNAEKRLHGALIQEARGLRGARPGTWAHRRLQAVKKQLRKLARKRRHTRHIPPSGISTDGKAIKVHADQVPSTRLFSSLSHELRHIRDKGMLEEVADAPAKTYWRRRARLEVRAERTGSYALGLTRRPIEGYHIRYPTGTPADSLYPPRALAKVSIAGYLNGATRALAGRFKNASKGALALSDAYLAGYREVLAQQAEHALGQPPLDPSEASKQRGKHRVRSWLAYRKLRGMKAYRRRIQRSKQRRQRLGDQMAAYEAGWRDASLDTPPHARLEAILSGRTGPVSMPPPQ